MQFRRQQEKNHYLLKFSLVDNTSKSTRSVVHKKVCVKNDFSNKKLIIFSFYSLMQCFVAEHSSSYRLNLPPHMLIANVACCLLERATRHSIPVLSMYLLPVTGLVRDSVYRCSALII